MDIKELLSSNLQAQKRLALITREIYEMLSEDPHSAVLGKTQINEMLDASFHFLKQSNLLLPMIEKELNLLGGEDGNLEAQIVKKVDQKNSTKTRKSSTKKAGASKSVAKKTTTKKTTAKKSPKSAEKTVIENQA